MTKLIERNTRFPCTQTKQFTMHVGNQSDVTIPMFEGEGAMIEDNNFLGNFTLKDIQLAPNGIATIVIQFRH